MCPVIRRNPIDQRNVKVTFSVPDAGQPVSVVGDFNGWNPAEHPMRKRSNGTRSVAVLLPIGSTIRFRYCSGSPAGASWFDDPDADGYEPNGYGETHAVVVV
ncbi:MAG: isoamylase early set domain-containing protein [Actinomycetota bacterium]|nr:MAG: isoamylase early set domain-containing protein [Actinomycetota bacterium]